jgi:hypothetical protein
VALAFPAFAEEAHHPEQAGKGPVAEVTTPASAAAPTVKKMQDNARKMQVQLERIAKTKNAAERERLVGEHMQTMHENLQLARGLGAPGMGCPMMGMGMMGGDAGAEPMMGRMQQLEKRMDMMQMMMEQMAKPTATK